MKKLINLLFFMFFLLFFQSVPLMATAASSQKITLLPPWFLLQKKLSAVLAVDPCVKVGSPEIESNNIEIKINVCDVHKAEALSAFIKNKYEWGAQTVTVKVVPPSLVPISANLPSNAQEAVDMLTRALAGNRYFVKAWAAERDFREVAVVEFAPRLVQYHADDISDWYLNTNDVASRSFNDIMNFNPYARDTVGVYATTTPLE